jgi:hypothetical protein
MTKDEILGGLKYIADSPSSAEYGGFHPQTVKTVEGAMEYIKKIDLTAIIAEVEKEIIDTRIDYTPSDVDEIGAYLRGLEFTRDILLRHQEGK